MSILGSLSTLGNTERKEKLEICNLMKSNSDELICHGIALCSVRILTGGFCDIVQAQEEHMSCKINQGD